jgi:phosphate transport system substrate-binding protein
MINRGNRDGWSVVRRPATVMLVGLLAVAATACGGGDEGGAGGSGEKLSGIIRVDGSSTVAPLTEAAGELFGEENSGVKVTVGTSGTGGGFEKFCRGETDISDASRQIKPEEAQACQAKGIRYEELTVANDGLAVVVNKENTWAKCLTVDQLKKIWGPDSRIDNWKQVDPSFPSEKLTLYGPGTDSGTFDYFTDEINGEEGASRTDYSASEDDNVTIQGVSGTKGGLGYFGLSYYEQNTDKLNVVQVNAGSGCIEPTKATVQDGSYKPLSRPLYIYPKAEAIQRPEVKAFLDFYVANSTAIAEQALFVAMTDQQRQEAAAKLDQLDAGA